MRLQPPVCHPGEGTALERNQGEADGWWGRAGRGAEACWTKRGPDTGHSPGRVKPTPLGHLPPLSQEPLASVVASVAANPARVAAGLRQRWVNNDRRPAPGGAI
jgi:hypothetical protein